MSDAFCDLLDSWDDQTPAERCNAVADWLLEAADDWDIELDVVTCGDVPPGRLATYDPATGVVTIDRDLFEGDSPWEALGASAHEFAHAFQDDAFDDAGLDMMDGLTPEDREAFEAWADWFALWFLDLEVEDCVAPASPTSAPASGPLSGDSPWESPPSSDP